MKAIKINYEFKRGDTQPLDKFNISDLNGTIINLTDDDKLFFTVKTNDSDTAIIKKNLEDGIVLGEDGYYHITLEAEDTEELDVDTYRYDIELDLATDNDNYYVKTIIEGKIKLLEDTTMKGDKE